MSFLLILDSGPLVLSFYAVKAPLYKVEEKQRWMAATPSFQCFTLVVQSLSRVQLLATPWTAPHQTSLSTISRSLLKLMSIELVMPSNHLLLCDPLLLLYLIFPSIRVFSNASALRIRWPKYWSFSFSISPSNEYSGLISFWDKAKISLFKKGLIFHIRNSLDNLPDFFLEIYKLCDIGF